MKIKIHAVNKTNLIWFNLNKNNCTLIYKNISNSIYLK